ncbi:acetyltransferase (GNAT) family protein [Breoghania corrubedonensis]|uniref:Acetyltransferase (GNAT) family protein n=1 Tax=Breoghania corrubedonensis TaxID=665038 RepID=A0A2T5V5Q9_9HYPH|nr:GNAT family N-acetyltransferase [Breoghania corrubedonensis]PTW59089.1 acetyltransferase (GNAT) family protein [Breoghania corrubedonensis]
MKPIYLEQVLDFVREVDLRFGAPGSGGARANLEQDAVSLLSSLNQIQRDQLAAGMAEVRRLLRASAVRVDVEAPESADARWCMQEYFQELARRFDAGFDPAVSNPADEATLRPPNGVFVIARLDGEPVGCGALKSIRPGMGELKRMWVADRARGLGVGRRIIEALEGRARDFAISLLRLETNRNLTEALSLYRSSGYLEVPAFNDEPYAHHWFEKEIG